MRMQINGVVDRLVGHRFFRVVGPKEPEFARYLLRRSEEFELMSNHLKQGAVRVQFGHAARQDATSLALRMSQIGIVDTGACALEFPAARTG
jgi:hypothetical protein